MILVAKKQTPKLTGILLLPILLTPRRASICGNIPSVYIWLFRDPQKLRLGEGTKIELGFMKVSQSPDAQVR